MQCLMSGLDERSTEERRKILVYKESQTSYRTGIDRSRKASEAKCKA